MKRIALMVTLIVLAIPLSAQSWHDRYSAEADTTSNVDIVYKRLLEKTVELDEWVGRIYDRLIRIESATSPGYKLYSTQNTWTFLELDTRFGCVYHVQWDLKNNDGRWLIGYANDITEPSQNYYPGRFELYPTSNIYNFILVDTRTGDTFQVQWSTESKNEGIWPIKKL